VRLHLITPCSRPENLSVIVESLRENLKGIDWQWWVMIDDRLARHPGAILDHRMWIFQARPQPETFAAGFLRNMALGHLSEGWAYGLDDDTIIHPQLAATLTKADQEGLNVAAWPVMKWNSDRVSNDPTQGDWADTAAFSWKVECFPELRWKDDDRNCDVHFFEELKTHPRAKLGHFPEPAAYYNYLRPPIEGVI
jgi:hypothetical protein